MFSNTDLLMNPTFKPYYMDATNMLMPLIQINTIYLYKMVENLVTNISQFVASIISLFTFISKDIIKVGTKYISQFYNNIITNNETQLLILIAVIFVVIFTLDKLMVFYMYHKSLQETLTKLDKEIATLKKHDRMRDNDWEILMQNNGLSYKNLRNEMLDNFKDTNKQFKRVDKQFKKIDKELTMYE
jgi:uncharacterized membrane protein YciS (DUF1049 family)